MQSFYLRWDYNNPEFAVAGTILHGFEFVFVRLAPPNIINKGSREKSLARKAARQRIKRTQQKATIKNEIYAHSVKLQLSDCMGLIFEKMCRDYASFFGKSRNYHYYIFSKGD